MFFLTLEFPVHPTTMVHPIILGYLRYIGGPDIFNQPCGNGTHKRSSFMKGGGSSLQGPSNSPTACFEIPFRLGPTQRWSNTIILASGNIRFILLIQLPQLHGSWIYILYREASLQIWTQARGQQVFYGKEAHFQACSWGRVPILLSFIVHRVNSFDVHKNWREEHPSSRKIFPLLSSSSG